MAGSESRLPLLDDLGRRRPALQLGKPGVVGVIARQVQKVAGHAGNRHGPRDKHEIGIGQLVADQILGLLLLQVGVDDARHAANLFGVAVDCRLELFGVVPREPDELAKVRALARHLEVLPDAGLVLFGRAGVLELVGGVIGVDEVVDYGARLCGVLLARGAELLKRNVEVSLFY